MRAAEAELEPPQGSVAKDEYDCAVVGGGVVGLMTALRLGSAGWRVIVIERDHLGAGATLSNHGVVHSGALFAQLHPEIVPSCYAAQAAYAASFPECVIDTELAWYLGTPERVAAFQLAWDQLGIPHAAVGAGDLESLLRAPAASGVHAAAVREVIISTRSLIEVLASRCLAVNVEIVTSAGAVDLVAGEAGVEGVTVGGTGMIRSRHVVLCCGIGAHALLQACGSGLVSRLKSRLDMMVSFPDIALQRPLLGLEYGWPTIAPARGGIALASRYGAPQPAVDRPGRWPVRVSEAMALVTELNTRLQPGIVDFDSSYAWVCSKTEYSAGTSDEWGVEPNFAVIDHGEAEGIKQLWTVLPGKMTLALHASRDLASRLMQLELALPLLAPTMAPPNAPTDLVAVSPWQSHISAQTARGQ
jgi:glycine/D-amino acid oxidase-like deaminating enzyme